MKRDLLLAGLVGVFWGASIYAGASVLSAHIPILLAGSLAEIVAFIFLLILALGEMPMMVIGLRQMTHSAATARLIVVGTFTFYVMFAALYASAFVLLTGAVAWGSVLAALSVMRWISGIWIQ